MNKQTQNIDNLTQLWKKAASSSNRQFESDAFETAVIPNTDWPNRIWSNKTSITAREIGHLKECLGSQYSNLTLSRFCSVDETPILPSGSIELKSIQYGMSLVLGKKFCTDKKMEFRKVSNRQESNTWSEAFASAFGYKIRSKTILDISNEVEFYLVYFQGYLVGTLLLFVTENVVGIHSLGIIPEKRRQGFAIETMRQALNRSIDLGLTLAVLQASEMAKNMYLNLGFTIDFLMNNYQIK